MTKTTTTDLAEQIAVAEQAVTDAQNRYRSRPRQGAILGQGVQQVQPQALTDRLDRGLEVDDAVIRLEQLKRQMAEAKLAELTDPATTATLEQERDAAERALQEAEAAATQARTALAHASGVLKDRQWEVRRWQDEKARAEAAIRGAQALRERERAQRDELVRIA